MKKLLSIIICLVLCMAVVVPAQAAVEVDVREAAGVSLAIVALTPIAAPLAVISGVASLVALDRVLSQIDFGVESAPGQSYADREIAAMTRGNYN